MSTSIAHISINVRDISFYRQLVKYLGFRIITEYPSDFGASDGSVSLWAFGVQEKYGKHPFHRKAAGLNHIAFRVGSREEVDAFYKDYLLANNVPVLYGGPALYLEYVAGYYAVYFEDPDRIKLEVAFIPGKHN